MLLVPTRALLADILADITQAASGTAGHLHAVFLGLYVAPTPVPNVNLLMADITEATFTGYARQAIVWGPPYVSQAGYEAMDAGSLHWQSSDAVTPNTITGVFIASAITAGVLLAAMKFDNPVALPDQFHLLDTLTRFALDPTAFWGDGDVVC